MSSFFYNIIYMNISASLIFIIFLIIKPFIKNIISKKTQYIILIIILLKFILPFSFEIISYKKIPILKETIPITKEITKRVEMLEKENTSDMNYNFEKNISENISKNNEIKKQVFHFKINDLIILYLIILFLYSIYFIYEYFKFNKILNKTLIESDDYLKDNLSEIKGKLKINRKVGIYKSQFITSPLLIGILKPKIIIPFEITNESQLKNILFHELCHFKHRDLEIKWVASFAVLFNFFNPLIYFLRKEISKTCELCCDESVIKYMTTSEKNDYGNTLIDIMELSSIKKNTGFIMMCEEKKNIKERLLYIMKFKQKNKLISIISLIIVLSFSTLGILASANLEVDQLTKNIQEVAEFRKTSKWNNFNEVLLKNNLLPKEIIERAGKLEDGTSKDRYFWTDIYRGPNEYKIGFGLNLRNNELVSYNYTNMGKGFVDPYHPITIEEAKNKIELFLRMFKNDDIIDKTDFNNINFEELATNNTNKNYKIITYKVFINEKHNYEFTVDLNMSGIIYFNDIYIEKLNERDVYLQHTTILNGKDYEDNVKDDEYFAWTDEKNNTLSYNYLEKYINYNDEEKILNDLKFSKNEIFFIDYKKLNKTFSDASIGYYLEESNIDLKNPIKRIKVKDNIYFNIFKIKGDFKENIFDYSLRFTEEDNKKYFGFRQHLVNDNNNFYSSYEKEFRFETAKTNSNMENTKMEYSSSSNSIEPKQSRLDFINSSFDKSFLTTDEYSETDINCSTYMIKKINPVSFIISNGTKVYDYKVDKYLGIEFMIFSNDQYSNNEIIKISESVYSLNK